MHPIRIWYALKIEGHAPTPYVGAGTLAYTTLRAMKRTLGVTHYSKMSRKMNPSVKVTHLNEISKAHFWGSPWVIKIFFFMYPDIFMTKFHISQFLANKIIVWKSPIKLYFLRVLENVNVGFYIFLYFNLMDYLD